VIKFFNCDYCIPRSTAKQVAVVWACVAKRRQWLDEEMHGVFWFVKGLQLTGILRGHFLKLEDENEQNRTNWLKAVYTQRSHEMLHMPPCTVLSANFQAYLLYLILFCHLFTSPFPSSR